jgi:hypothetical protein
MAGYINFVKSFKRLAHLNVCSGLKLRPNYGNSLSILLMCVPKIQLIYVLFVCERNVPLWFIDTTQWLCIVSIAN